MVLSPQQKRIAMISLGVLVVLVIAGVGFFMMNRRKETPKVLQPVLQVTAAGSSEVLGKYLVFDENDGISFSSSQGTPIQTVNAVVNGVNVQQLQFKNSGQFITVFNKEGTRGLGAGGIVVQGSSTFQTSGAAAGDTGVSLFIQNNQVRLYSPYGYLALSSFPYHSPVGRLINFDNLGETTSDGTNTPVNVNILVKLVMA